MSHMEINNSKIMSDNWSSFFVKRKNFGPYKKASWIEIWFSYIYSPNTEMDDSEWIVIGIILIIGNWNKKGLVYYSNFIADDCGDYISQH